MNRYARTLLVLLWASCTIGGLACSAETDLSEVLARLKALEEKNKELELRLKQAEARPGANVAIDKAMAASEQKMGKVVTAPAPHDRPLVVSGYLDFSYEYNFTRPDNQKNNLRFADTDSNGFNLHLAEVNFARLPTEPGEVGFKISTNFGTDQRFIAAQDNLADPSLRLTQYKDVELQQAYIEYIAPVGKGITFDFGKFATHHGAEVFEAYDDINASRSFLFAYAIPATHTGVKATYEVFKGSEKGGRWAVMAGLVNGWDNIQDQNNAKSWMFSSNWQATGWFNWVFNAMYGDEQFVDERARLRAATAPALLTGSPLTNGVPGDYEGTFDDPSVPGIGSTLTGRLWDSHDKGGRLLFDTIMTFTPWEKWTFVINADYAHETNVPAFNGPSTRSWWGVAGYAK
ncbi:MAG: outer membrane beta-barrel protein, partial [Planctomycetota bacterium]|nr:outer membrane beta-barrel protein [Planctomycetota bacterium]